MTCQACGRDVFEDDLYCGRCGAKLPGGARSDTSVLARSGPPGLHDPDPSPTTYPTGEELIVGGGHDLRPKLTTGGTSRPAPRETEALPEQPSGRGALCPNCGSNEV